MERRDVLLGAGALIAAAATSAAGADEHGMHMHQHGDQKYPTLAAAAADCVKTGEICIDHCLDLFADGDTSTAACARSVNDLLSVCATLRHLATQNSKHLPKFAKVAADICRDCEKECRKHEKEHSQCRDCADSCAACAKECDKAAT